MEKNWPASSPTYKIWKEKRMNRRRMLNLDTFFLIIHPGLELILGYLDRYSLTNLADAADEEGNFRLSSIINDLYDTKIRNPFDVRTTFRWTPIETFCMSYTPASPFPITRKMYCMCDKCIFGTYFLEKGRHYVIDEDGRNLRFITPLLPFSD